MKNEKRSRSTFKIQQVFFFKNKKQINQNIKRKMEHHCGGDSNVVPLQALYPNDENARGNIHVDADADAGCAADTDADTDADTNADAHIDIDIDANVDVDVDEPRKQIIMPLSSITYSTDDVDDNIEIEQMQNLGLVGYQKHSKQERNITS